MSKVFYDKLVALEHIEKEVNKIAETREEREELYRIIDEYIHHRIMGCILGKLPNEHHEEFLNKFVDAPHHDDHWIYLKDKIQDDVEGFLKSELSLVASELMEVIKGPSKKKLH